MKSQEDLSKVNLHKWIGPSNSSSLSTERPKRLNPWLWSLSSPKMCQWTRILENQSDHLHKKGRNIIKSTITKRSRKNKNIIINTTVRSLWFKVRAKVFLKMQATWTTLLIIDNRVMSWHSLEDMELLISLNSMTTHKILQDQVKKSTPKRNPFQKMQVTSTTLLITDNRVMSWHSLEDMELLISASNMTTPRTQLALVKKSMPRRNPSPWMPAIFLM